MQSGCRKVEGRGVKGRNVARERAKMVGKRRFGARVYEKRGGGGTKSGGTCKVREKKGDGWRNGEHAARKVEGKGVNG